MAEYLIRTDKEERKTHIIRVVRPAEIAGLIYTDFKLQSGNRDINLEDVVNPASNTRIAQVHLYEKGNIISVTARGRELCAVTLGEEYREEGVIIPCRMLPKEVLLAGQHYQELAGLGVTHAYFLGNNSAISQVFCFERDGNISGVVHTKEQDDTSALKGLALTLLKRIKTQEFIFEFMRR